MKVKKQFLFFVTSALVLVSCNFLNSTGFDSNKPTAEELVTLVKIPAVVGTPEPIIPYGSDWLVYQNLDFGYTLSYPNTWKLVNNDESKSVDIFPPESNPDFPSPMIHIEVVDREYLSKNTLVKTDSPIEDIEVAGLAGKHYSDSEFSVPEQSSYIELPLNDKTLFIVTTIGPTINLSNQMFEILRTFVVN